MLKWTDNSAPTAESGILRKPYDCKQDADNLLVFGYACKLFRDDERALYVDQGKHLIPWMGNDALRIDRYDCRGALSDLVPFEAGKEGYDALRWLGLNESDRKLEQLCDRERYYSLEVNEEDELMYKEEEEKRKSAIGTEFGYNYENDDVNGTQADSEQRPSQNVPAPTEMDLEEQFVTDPMLDLPADIETPRTIKENQRIEKTASFVCQQGTQMEILIKTKQKDNEQFAFLNKDHNLHKYYRFILDSMKSGRYPMKVNDNHKDSEKNDQVEEQHNQHYLHPVLSSKPVTTDPSLLPSSTSTPSLTHDTTTLLPHITYKPSENCSYSQLVNLIRGNTQQQRQLPTNDQQAIAAAAAAAAAASAASAAAALDVASLTPEERQQYYQYYYSKQYYEYYNQMAQYQYRNYYNGTLYDNQKNQPLQQQQQGPPTVLNPYAQIVTNLSNNHSEETASANAGRLVEQPPLPGSGRQASTVSSSGAHVQHVLSMLSQYGSEDEEDEEVEEKEEEERKQTNDGKDVVKMENGTECQPQGDCLIVIDKMAAYVAKNGEPFEKIVMSKNDPRFQFLNVSHKYHKYYRHKIAQIKGIVMNENLEEGQNTAENGKSPPATQSTKEPSPELEEQQQPQHSPSKTPSPKSPESPPSSVIENLKKTPTPVCFSLKKAIEPPREMNKSALPVEEDTDDEEEDQEVVVPVPPEVEAVFVTNDIDVLKPTDEVVIIEEDVVIVPDSPTVISPDIKETETRNLVEPPIDMFEPAEPPHRPSPPSPTILETAASKTNNAICGQDNDLDPAAEAFLAKASNDHDDIVDELLFDIIGLDASDSAIVAAVDQRNSVKTVISRPDIKTRRMLQIERRKRVEAFLKLKQSHVITSRRSPSPHSPPPQTPLPIVPQNACSAQASASTDDVLVVLDDSESNSSCKRHKKRKKSHKESRKHRSKRRKHSKRHTSKKKERRKRSAPSSSYSSDSDISSDR